MQVKKGEIFNSIAVQDLPRNTFDLTHQHATTIDFADLVPICVMEAVPGDIFEIGSETFIRFQPLITPMMHRCDFTVHYFFVPNRLLWDGWEDFITGNLARTTGLSTPAAPTFDFAQLAFYPALDNAGSLLNYMGCEIDFISKLGSFSGVWLSALPPAAYQKIYWDYYVPKELVQEATPTADFVKLTDGNQAPSSIPDILSLRQKGWLRDYFTSALPYAQKGEQVALPTGDFPETRIRREPDGETGAQFIWDGTTQPGADPGEANVLNQASSSFSGSPGALYLPETPIGVTTINDLRRAMRLQEWLEKNARAGTRYTESIKIHFNVNSSDARLQRAEYITGVKSPIIVSEVLNTTGTAELPQGNMAGHGMGIANSYDEKYFCEEHGFIIGILSVTPRPAYTTGLPRLFVKREDSLDYYWYEFANIGEQEILNVELAASYNTPTDATGTFGYIPRYSEYKFKNDMITGDFADTSTAVGGSLRTWVMQRTFGNDFGQEPTLNPNFITGDIKTVAAAPFAIEEKPIMVQQVNKLNVSRLMPVYGTPKF